MELTSLPRETMMRNWGWIRFDISWSGMFDFARRAREIGDIEGLVDMSIGNPGMDVGSSRQS